MNDRWLGALERQMAFWSEALSSKVIVDTIFFGGGTPSLLPNPLLIRLGEIIKKSFRTSEDLEFSAECNPETIDEAKIKALKALGANRLSVGIQSFDDEFLKVLERRTSQQANNRALDLLKKAWEGRLSVDLMFGLPNQSLDQWKSDLEQALSWGFTHLSAYQLTLSSARSKLWQQPNEDLLADMTEHMEGYLGESGWEQYEVSNFAKPGFESRHNLKYWELQPFLGLGPGASGLLSGRLLGGAGFSRFGAHQKQPDNFEKWEFGAGDEDFEFSNLKSRDERMHLEELLMMSLRLKKGLEKARLGPQITEALATFQDNEIIEDNRGHWQMTSSAYPLLDHYLPKIYKKIEEFSGPALDSGQIDPKF